MDKKRFEVFFARPQRTVAIGDVFLACVALMALLVPAEPLAIDNSWSEAMKDKQSSWLKDLALVFNTLGRGLATTLTLGAIAIVLLIARRWLALIAFAVVESLTPLTTWLLKVSIDRPRPADALVHPVGSSFPSGHASYAGATSIALVALFTVAGPRRPLWWTLAALVIVGMAWSRTYLQVHWLSDVIAGSLLGAGISLAVFGIAQLWSRSRERPQLSPAHQTERGRDLRSSTAPGRSRRSNQSDARVRRLSRSRVSPNTGPSSDAPCWSAGRRDVRLLGFMGNRDVDRPLPFCGEVGIRRGGGWTTKEY